MTGLDALTNSEVALAVTAVIDADDVRGLLYSSLPAGFRGTATWLMNDAIRAHIQGFADASGTLGQFTVDLSTGYVERLLGRPLQAASAMSTDTAPNATTDFPFLVGDFSNYIIVHKLDATLEFIQNIMDPTTNRPIGERGWVLWGRHGGSIGSTNNTSAGPGNAFRMAHGIA